MMNTKKHWLGFPVTKEEQDYIHWLAQRVKIGKKTGVPVSTFIRSRIGLPTDKIERAIFAYTTARDPGRRNINESLRTDSKGKTTEIIFPHNLDKSGNKNGLQNKKRA